ncbi:MAG: chemotaxis protein CheD [Oscillospiraceae bacterium]|nr:chemotaxis protein CheD [Oscillospiraceae bacterium]
MASIVKVGIADLNVVKSPDSLISYALGSCVGICLYDEMAKVAGMSHILLPSKLESDSNLMKFADTAIPLLVEKMVEKNARKIRMVAKIAGGANMFSGMMRSSTSRIGERNVAQTKETLKKLGIRIVAEDTGGTYGRTIEFSGETGILYVRSISNQNKEL